MSVIIRMKNLPMTAGAADVRTFFSGLKIPDGAVHIIGGDEGEVFVGFASDEDARIAMMKNGRTIHNAEIRLLLSSKSEQNAVIMARKNGTYSSPTASDDFVPVAPTQPLSAQIWSQPGSNPYAARSGYEASYPPQGSIHSAYNSQNNFNKRPDNLQPPLLSSPKKEEPKREEYNYKESSREEYDYKEAPRGEYGYKASFQAPPPGRFGSGPPRASEPLKSAAHMPPQSVHQSGPQMHQPPSSQISPNSNYGYRGSSNGPSHGPSGRVPHGGDSWRDNNYSHAKNDFGGNKFNPRNGPPADSRKELPLPSNAPFQPSMNNASYSNRPPIPHNRQFANGPPPQNQNGSNAPPPAYSNRNGPPPFQNGPHMNRVPPVPLAPLNRNGSCPPPFQNALNPSSHLPMKPAIPPVVAPVAPVSSSEKFYIELTRLPNELLRPAALEAFIHPSAPLTLSSVKTVFGPGGIHMHTIIRLDSIADYATMMRRNGEQGIKIQQSDKKAFEAADDAAPVPIVAPSVVKNDDDSAPRRKSRWGDKSPLKDRDSPRRNSNRSRSPAPRKRRRSRSPRRREEHTDPTRWCIQVTNVPFRMKDDELIEWFSEKVRPAKLSRTFYSDGNASDRWVAEFSSESLMRRAFSIRTLCQGRTLKLSYIDNEKADEIMKIEDVYGKEKRQINEEAREVAEKSNPPSFFNQPSVVPRVPPPVATNNFSGSSNGAPSSGLPPPNGPPPTRGAFASRGNGFPPRGGMMSGPPNGRGQPGPGAKSFFQKGPNPFNNGPSGSEGFRGGFHGAGGFRGGRGGGRGGGFPGSFRDEQQVRSDLMDLIKSLGPQGTVLSCSGFPADVTLEDVANFFSRYDPDRNSIRIRRGEDGIMTGDCMLACYNANDARQAALDLDGQRWHNSTISVRQV